MPLNICIIAYELCYAPFYYRQFYTVGMWIFNMVVAEIEGIQGLEGMALRLGFPLILKTMQRGLHYQSIE